LRAGGCGVARNCSQKLSLSVRGVLDDVAAADVAAAARALTFRFCCSADMMCFGHPVTPMVGGSAAARFGACPSSIAGATLPSKKRRRFADCSGAAAFSSRCRPLEDGASPKRAASSSEESSSATTGATWRRWSSPTASSSSSEL
jgi:hypothetical protein